MQNYILISFLQTFPCQLLYFANKFQNTGHFSLKLTVNWNLLRTHNIWYRNVQIKAITTLFHIIFHFPFIHCTLQTSASFKNNKDSKKLLVFGENESRYLSNFLQTHIFWNLDHISRIYNQIKYRNIWFEKVTITIIMTAQVLYFHVFLPKKTRTLMLLNRKKVCSSEKVRQIKYWINWRRHTHVGYHQWIHGIWNISQKHLTELLKLWRRNGSHKNHITKVARKHN